MVTILPQVQNVRNMHGSKVAAFTALVVDPREVQLTCRASYHDLGRVPLLCTDASPSGESRHGPWSGHLLAGTSRRQPSKHQGPSIAAVLSLHSRLHIATWWLCNVRTEGFCAYRGICAVHASQHGMKNQFWRMLYLMFPVKVCQLAQGGVQTVHAETPELNIGADGRRRNASGGRQERRRGGDAAACAVHQT